MADDSYEWKGIRCDDSQDCPRSMFCEDFKGDKRCRRLIDPNIGLYILSGVFIVIIVIVLVAKFKYGVTIQKSVYELTK